MNVNLFRLALGQLEPSDWAHFERLCSAFLISDFSTQLRTMAAPSGDGGRDSELFTPEQKTFITIQYSVAKDWKAKIQNTATRLAKFQDVRVLIYMSNQQIGGQADELRKSLLEKNISLDVRDRNWFVERALSDSNREVAANELIDRIARPYLAGENVINKSNSPLTTGEAKAALVYLGLQWQDDITDKGLTKLSFDALVRAALRSTDSENRLLREQIHENVCAALRTADQGTVIRLVDAALERLQKRYIRHWQKEDAFCLTFEEQQRILSRIAEVEVEEADLQAVIINSCAKYLTELQMQSTINHVDLIARVRRILEKFLLKRGEVFVAAVISGDLNRAGLQQMEDIILADLQATPVPSMNPNYPIFIFMLIKDILVKNDPVVQGYLRRLSASYTLFSFLNQTPDVQSATRKLFSHGTIWLDTTVLLPVFSEQLEDEANGRRFTKLFQAARASGVELKVTTGILQELNSHMNYARICSERHTTWQGRTPYLYYQYLRMGEPPTNFKNWLSMFRGSERPDDDIAQFLRELLGVEREDLIALQDEIDEELRFAAERLWAEAHKFRRANKSEMDDTTTQILVKNDIETYLGVVALRKKEPVSELGYRHWLLTLDTVAWDIRDKLKSEFSTKVPPSPLLSISYLFDSVTFGAARSILGKSKEFELPFILDTEMSESMEHDIIEVADKVRMDNAGLPDYVIRRKVRDEIDRTRRRRNLLPEGRQE